SPSGGDDTNAINSAISGCTAGQYVRLNCGTFQVSAAGTIPFIFINKGIVLRGCGPQFGASGSNYTLIVKTDGAQDRTNTPIGNGVNSNILTPANYNTWDANPVILVGNAEFPAPDSTTSVNLSADCAQGSTSCSFGSVVGFSVGHVVLLDERAN